MTIKEAILKVLNEQKQALTYLEVLEKINETNLVDWTNAKTPSDTIGAQLGHFIRKNDSRVQRIKSKKGFIYYASKYEKDIVISDLSENKEYNTAKNSKVYHERPLHTLLSSYLKNQNISCKTIFHERSLNGKDDHQKWIHPDVIAIEFNNLKNTAGNSLMKIVNNGDAFNLFSYEIKREIKSDHELKKCFFQAVSNSSWSNYGYLVAFEISKNLLPEMERLNQSFGIGIIELKANPYESKILFHSKYRGLDFKTIDKLCEINKDFESFIRLTESLLTASEKYKNATQKELNDFCDDFFERDSEIEQYCIDNNIPWNE